MKPLTIALEIVETLVGLVVLIAVLYALRNIWKRSGPQHAFRLGIVLLMLCVAIAGVLLIGADRHVTFAAVLAILLGCAGAQAWRMRRAKSRLSRRRGPFVPRL